MSSGWKWGIILAIAVVLAMLVAGWTWDDAAHLWH